MGKAAVGILIALLATELRWVRGCKEDTVLGGYVDIMGRILVASCELSAIWIVDSAC